MAVNFGQERYHSDFLPWEGRLTEFFDAGRLASASRCASQVVVVVEEGGEGDEEEGLFKADAVNEEEEEVVVVVVMP